MKAWLGGALVLAALGISAPAAAQTAQGCDGPRTGFDNVYCFAKIYMQLDAQLNSGYTALMRSIPAGQRNLLRSGQREWMAMRDRRCLKQEGDDNTVNIDCAIDTTRSRVQFLSDRSAECKANGCRMSLLGNVE